MAMPSSWMGETMKGTVWRSLWMVSEKNRAGSGIEKRWLVIVT